jgi:hypothetical protein
VDAGQLTAVRHLAEPDPRQSERAQEGARAAVDRVARCSSVEPGERMISFSSARRSA